MWNNRSRRGRWSIFFPLMAAIVALILGAVVMFLWNAILPSVANAKPISYWQAVGLLILSRILFGNFRRSPGGPPSRRRAEWKEKWMKMSDEERNQFRASWKERCGPKKEGSQ